MPIILTPEDPDDDVVEIPNAVDDDGNTTIVAGDDYLDGLANPSLKYTIKGYAGPTISGSATAKWMAIPKGIYDRGELASPELTVDGAATQSGTTITVKVPLTAGNTASLSHLCPPEPRENYVVVVKMIISGKVMTEAIGKGTVLKGLTPSA